MNKDEDPAECPAWDGSDACCNPEQGGKGDDVQYVKSVVEAITAKYNVDTSRVYLMGIATGGFMANRLACEAPEMFAGVVSFAGSTWKDPSRCDPPSGRVMTLQSRSLYNLRTFICTLPT